MSKWNNEEDRGVTSEQGTVNKRKYKDNEEKEEMVRMQYRRKKEGRMIFWNVAGVKGKEEDFWNFIKEFEVVGLPETWLEEKEEATVRRKLEGEFEVEMMAASRKTGKGRPKGGIILAIKKGIYEEEINARKWKGREFIGKEVKRQGGRMYVGATYMRECRKENREMMEDIMEITRSGHNWRRL